MRQPGEPVYRIFRGSDIGASVYRVVERCPPGAGDFTSYAAAGRGFPSRMLFRATGVSMYSTRQRALRWAPHHGRAVAELHLADVGVYVARVSPPDGHLVVWAEPSALIGCLLSCEHTDGSVTLGAAAYLVIDNASRNVLHASKSLEDARDIYLQLVVHDPSVADHLTIVLDHNGPEEIPRSEYAGPRETAG